ncbi:hypothetical protein [Clostridium coskatii]|uniref:Uncharacterized protein n=1 Tax=Clostridium coskatii TaxID=1705578 RepID=A0A162NFU1_9CLOT|nr:hypothetical protein [Clostridium coskatii]OAA93039.1 hypothetical protein WX73_00357 [Clostridium coskatii]OBR90782.1 hypothetical protein CLCOS_37570 [Clostridium coskatii]
MLKQLFEDVGIEVTDQEFKEILKMTTDDIRENRIKFDKRTNLNEVSRIALRAYKVIERVMIN